MALCSCESPDKVILSISKCWAPAFEVSNFRPKTLGENCPKPQEILRDSNAVGSLTLRAREIGKMTKLTAMEGAPNYLSSSFSAHGGTQVNSCWKSTKHCEASHGSHGWGPWGLPPGTNTWMVQLTKESGSQIDSARSQLCRNSSGYGLCWISGENIC